ncbi:hypothetical protein I2F27_05775 [Acinetobacter sp. B5B]|uniref:hypothetical protein n=1 Tax=Acinetobacter baretiae TaxID=2605383 RepID=UPI0018C1FD0B|nr:hypothetical protein [Acinetobacter baretiae]MBF7682841.1 hypothetical protein [Acinetobacter baretiae]MBF7685463.1 hypothetical protein [Acinetobacter baretiae]
MADNQSNIEKGSLAAASQEDLSELMTVSAGFVDVFKIRCANQATIVLPQNLILSVQTQQKGIKHVQWHGVELPVYEVHTPDVNEVTALIVENEQIEQRFVILCDEMPEAHRLRISEVVDVYGVEKETKVFQYVRIHQELCQIPVLNEIYAEITTNKT